MERVSGKVGRCREGGLGNPQLVDIAVVSRVGGVG